MLPSIRTLALTLVVWTLTIPTLIAAEQIPLADKQDSPDSSNVRVTIYPPSDYSCSTDGDTEPVSMSVAPGVCLSSDYGWDDTVRLEAIGRCPSGITPYVALYPFSADCTGEHSHPNFWNPTPRNPNPKPERCLSKGAWIYWNRKISNVPRGPWSMVIRCQPKEEAARAQGGTEIVKMPTQERPAWKDEMLQMYKATAAQVADGVCGVPNYHSARDRVVAVEPDTCTIMAPNGRLKIHEAAVCPNGTRALIAHWDQSRICKGKPAILKEVTDDMIDTCIDIGSSSWSAYVFWCTGHLWAPRSRIPTAMLPPKVTFPQNQKNTWTPVVWNGKEWKKKPTKS